jgi:sec-independent protein translocase protein TatA
MSGGEILLVMVALLLLFGSKNLPGIARNIGKSIESFRRASREVTDEIMRADLDRDPPPVKKPVPLASDAAPPASDPEDGPEVEEPSAPVVTPAAQSVRRDNESSGS